MTDTEMRVLRTSSTKSISGRSTLTYRLGADADNNVYISISKNSSTGQFSAEWVMIDDILKALEKGHKGSPLTSFLLEPLFKGKSVNTPAFVMAALTQEKLLRVLKGKKRGHEFLDPEDFKARMDKLVTSGKTTGVARKKTVRKAATKKAQVRKKAAARRKQ